MSDEKGPKNGGVVGVGVPPKQFVPRPQMVAPVEFSALTVHPGDVLKVVVAKPQAEGHEQAFNRPWVVVSTNRAHRRELNLVVAVPLTFQFDSPLQSPSAFREARIRILKQHISSSDSWFKQEDCLALTEHVRSISLERCPDRRKVGQVSSEALNAIRAALRYILGLGSSPKPSP